MNKDQIDRLLREGVFPNGDYGQKLIETYISWIIIGKRYAYKLKKPLKFSFIDFSTLTKRKFYCQEELRLNRRLTKGIYLDVLSICKNDKNKYYVTNKKCKVIDCLIQMKKMKLSKQMDRLLEKDKVSKDQIERIALIVSEFHKTAKKIYSKFKVKEELNEINDILKVKDFMIKNMASKNIDKLNLCIKRANEFVMHNEKLFIKRTEEGFVRDCHGDMHTKNIFLYKQPVIFDCIEFNPKFRQIDILSEIAFLCMDLEAFNKPELSSCFVEAYGKENLDQKGLNQLFIYFKMKRSMIRVKVNVLTAIQKMDNCSRQKDLNEAEKYIEHMLAYALQL